MSQSRSLVVQRSVSWIAAAIPAVGLSWLLGAELVSQHGGPPPDFAFHLLLGIGLLAFFSEFAVAIGRCSDPKMILALGTGGFVAIVIAAVLSELLGPPVMFVLWIAVAAWGVQLLRHRVVAQAQAS